MRPRPLGLIPLTSLLLPAMFAGCATTPAQEKGEASSKSVVADAPAPRSTAGDKTPAMAAARVAFCPMEISNPPPAGEDGKVAAGPLVSIKGVTLILAPATNVCLSSGFGERAGRMHRGVDYFSKNGGDVLAAGDGVIREAVSRSDFGNMIVIDHGNGVFTRYAHLAAFGQGSRAGKSVKRGQKLGPIGKTGATGILHLHFEILTGTYVSGVGSFGLSTHNPFDLPPAKGDLANAERAEGAPA